MPVQVNPRPRRLGDPGPAGSSDAPRPEQVGPAPEQNRRRFPPILVSRRFVWFFLGSGAGLVIDLGGFASLTAVGTPTIVANLCSSFASITVVYLLVTRYSFGVGTRTSTYVIFVLWYSTAIVAFSLMIGAAVTVTGLLPIECKLASVPFSFALNYSFSRVLFRQR